MKSLNNTDVSAILKELQSLKKEILEFKNSTKFGLLTMEEICELTKFSRKHIYHMINEGTFPPQIKIGSASRWKLIDYQAWLTAKFNDSAA